MKVSLLFLHLLISIALLSQEANDPATGPIPFNLDNSDITKFDVIKPLLQNSEIIAMGEATHGTSEFFTSKTKFFRSLVTELGYKIFVIEGFFTSAEEVNEYVTTGTGNPFKAIIGMGYGIWYTEEMFDLIQWIKDYNDSQSEQNKIRIYGCDMTFAAPSVDRLITFMTDESIVDSPINNVLHIIKENKRSPFSTKEMVTINQELGRLKTLINDTEKDSRMLFQYVRLLEQYVTLVSNNKKVDASLRDQFMAENVQWIRMHTGEKMFVWAHNAHVMKRTTPTGIKPMGEFLKDMFAEKYYSIGLLFNKGKFSAVNIDTSKKESIEVGDAQSGFIENYLTGLGTNFLIPISIETPEFFKEWNIRMIGEGYYPSNEKRNYQSIVPSESFDAILFINDTRASIPLDFNKLK